MTDKLQEKSKSFAEHHPVMGDVAKRRQKGEKIADILLEEIGACSGLSILDIGCSNGITLDMVTRRLFPVTAIGIDMDLESLPASSGNRSFAIMDGESLGFGDESFDIVICNHTYEHVPDSVKLMDEIYRVLKPRGIVYFGAMNRLWPLEPHYKLPLVHWIPKSLTYPIMKISGHNHIYIETPKTIMGLKKLVHRFMIKDYTLDVIKNPEKYHATDLITSRSRSRIFYSIARLLYFLLPSYIWILQKHKSHEG